MSTQALSVKPGQSESVNIRRIWLAGLVGIVASVIANLLLLTILKAVLPLPGDYPSLQPGAIIFFTTFGTFLAAVAFYIVARVSNRPVSTFRIVTVVALIISVLPNIIFMINPSAAPFPGGSTLVFGVLILFHVMAALVCYLALTRLTRN